MKFRSMWLIPHESAANCERRSISNIAPTALDLLGLAKPDEMLGETLCR